MKVTKAMRMEGALWHRVEKEAKRKKVTSSEMFRRILADYFGCTTEGIKERSK